MKILELPHKVCDYTCMVNGLEDLYEAAGGVRLPDWFFFYMGGMGGFAYIKHKNAPAPCMVGWGTNIKAMYRSLSELVGFEWHMTEGKSWSTTLRLVKEAIDSGKSPVLGCLDMYHLPYYENFYHQLHIPIHYVHMVGYDDDSIYIHDNGLPDAQRFPYTDLQQAWDVHVHGLSLKNTFHIFDFKHTPPSVGDMAHRALQARAHDMLQPPAQMLGIPGMRKLARELPHWPEQLDPEALKASLYYLAEYTGSPPCLPGRLMGETGVPDDHSGARREYAGLLQRLADEYGVQAWREAGLHLCHSGELIEQLTDVVVDYLLGERPSLDEAGELLVEVADTEIKAYSIIQQTT